MAMISPELTALWAEHAGAKCAANIAAGKPSYTDLLDQAWLEVSKEAQAQIDTDIPRTFISLPEGLRPASADAGVLQASLKRILLATEWRNSNANSICVGSAYTQGMNALAAMCLAGLAWQEERAFWLYTLLLEDVLSLSFFAEWPPLLSYHSLNAVAVLLLQGVCPRLAAALGEQLADVATMLSIQLFITCFVYCIPAEPLLALWGDLLSDDGGGFRRRPLLYWFLGLLHHFEAELMQTLQDAESDIYSSEATAVFQAALKLMAELSPGWRPAAAVACPPGPQLEQLVREEEARIRDEAQVRHLLRNSKSSKIQRSWVDTLHREFAAMRHKEGDIISFNTLCTLLGRVSPQADAETNAGQLFWLLDRENSGSLDFLELMTGFLVLCEGSRDGKLRLLFDLYDTDQSGYLDRDELVPLSIALMKVCRDSSKDSSPRLRAKSDQDGFRRQSDLEELTPTARRRSRSSYSLDDERYSKSAEHLRRRLLLLDKRGEGRLSFDDFCLGISGDAVLTSCLAHVGKETMSRELPAHLVLSQSPTSTLQSDLCHWQSQSAASLTAALPPSSENEPVYCRQFCRNLCVAM